MQYYEDKGTFPLVNFMWAQKDCFPESIYFLTHSWLLAFKKESDCLRERNVCMFQHGYFVSAALNSHKLIN